MSDIQVQIQEVETISKQAVIDAFKVWLIDNNDMRRFEEVVRDLQPVKQIQTCEDAVSRQDAIMHINFALDAEDAVKRVKEMPPVTPTRPKGKWIRQTDDHHDYYECEYCGIAVGLDDIKNYCPNCGADMREGET